MTRWRWLPVLVLALAVPLAAGCGDKGEPASPAGGGGTAGPAAGPGGGQPALAQAVPVWGFFVSCRDGDLALFKTIWSKKFSAQMEANGWEEGLSQCTREFGPLMERGFSLEEFEFTFEDGVVSGTLEGDELPPFNVEEEDGVWKISDF